MDDNFCRICRGTDPVLEVVCNCRGSVGLVHRVCINYWQEVSNRDTCEICHSRYRYSVERIIFRVLLVMLVYTMFNVLLVNKPEMYMWLTIILGEVCIKEDRQNIKRVLRLDSLIRCCMYLALLHPVFILKGLIIMNVYIVVVMNDYVRVNY